jgi:hypothetical protein
MFEVLGYVIVSPRAVSADLVVAWEDTTFRKPRPYPQARWGVPAINGRCLDISKRQVDRTVASVFGYSRNVDPTSYQGRCIAKANQNAKHKVDLLDCPIANPADDRVYQRYIDLAKPEGYLEEIRIAVVGSEIPLCWRRINALEDLALQMKGRGARRIPVPAAEVLSPEEIDLVLAFCDALGLDIGELDAGRDVADQRLYIFDANSTPYARRSGSTDEEKAFATEVLAAAFARQFGPVICPGTDS